MGRQAAAQVAFNGGELSPKMAARVDQEVYGKGCSILESFIPDIAGPAVKRGGTKYSTSTKDAADRAWFVRFEVDPENSYMLEFGPLYIRFTWNREPLLSGGVPYEVVTPYTAADLINSAGAFAIDYVQSGDIIYLACLGHAPRKLSRTAHTSWALSTYEPGGGPFQDVNITSTTVYASGSTGSITLHASASLFTSDMVDTLFYLEQKTVLDVEQWEPGKAITAGDVRRSGGRNYQAVNSATTGTSTPIHTEGSVYDGDGGVQWTYLDPGYGWAKITAYTSATQVSATVQSRIPDDAVGSGNASTKWALGAWSDTEGWPDVVTFFLDRLVWCRDSYWWMTVAGDYEVMEARDHGRQLTDSAAFGAIPSRRGNRILWAEALEAGLCVGTGADEWLIGPASRNEPFGPANASVSPLGVVGSRAVPPLRLFDSVIFTQRSGKRLRDMRYVIGDGAMRSDLNVLASHILKAKVTWTAYTDEPYSAIWAGCADGTLAVAAYYPEQSVLGWARVPFDGFVEHGQAIPAPDGGSADLWLLVRRTINGSTVRHIEYMTLPLQEDGEKEDAFYVDAGITYDGLATNTITGLDHLEGKTVAILADGATHPTRTVSGGQITLQRDASKVHVGLPFAARLATMDLEAGSTNGTAQGKQKRISHMTVRLDRTLGGKVGPSPSKLETLQFRDASVPMGSSPDLFTGDKRAAWPGGTERYARVWFVHEDPLPATVCGVFPVVNTED